MEKIRKGNDTKILWEIMQGNADSGIPYNLAGKNLSFYIKSFYKMEKVENFTVKGNVLQWTFAGKDQVYSGEYTLTLIENEGEEGMHTVDECKAFELVDCSCMEGGEAESHVRIETIRLKSGISVNSIVPDKKLDVDSGNVVENAAIAKEFQRVDEDIKRVSDTVENQGREIVNLGETLSEHGDALDVLNGEGEGSVKKTVADEVARIVADAPEDYDNLKEIADYIASDKTGAAQINNTLYAHGKAISAIEKEIEDISPAPMVSVTYAELVELRDAGKLIAGMQYRITDYVTITTQEDTQSAGHQFDVIVTADDESTLNEVARACQTEIDIEKYKDAYSNTWGEKMLYVGLFTRDRKVYHLYESASQDMQMLMDFNNPNILVSEFPTQEYPYSSYPLYVRFKEDGYWGAWLNGREEGESFAFKHNLAEDIYFNGANLSAWQIWYSLDNDDVRFSWVSKDDVTCAFCRGNHPIFPKEFDRKIVPAIRHYDDVEIDGSKTLYSVDLPDGTQFYLLENGDIYDESERQIGRYEIRNGKGVIYRMIDEWNNDCPYDFKNILFRRGIYDQSINITYDGDEDHTIYAYVFSWLNEDNTVEDLSLIGNSRLKSDEDLIVGVRCNRIGSAHDALSTGCIQLLNDVVFLDGYHSDGNNFYGYYNNTVGKDCYAVSAQANCVRCTIGDECHRIHLYNWTIDNTVGSGCADIVIYANALHNEIGALCSFIFLEEPCEHINIGTNCNGIALSDSTNINIGMNCRNLILSRVSDSTVINGVQNATLSEFGNSFVGTTSSGKVTSFVLADLVAS